MFIVCRNSMLQTKQQRGKSNEQSINQSIKESKNTHKQTQIIQLNDSQSKKTVEVHH